MDQKHELLLEHARQQSKGARVVMALLHTASLIDRACATELSKFDLSEGRLSVLLAAAKSRGATPAFLAEQLGITRAAITGLVDGLERQGLIRRSAHPADRRSMTIEVTVPGQEVLDRLVPIYGAWLQELSTGISTEAADDALDVFAAIQHSLGGGSRNE
ncbi:MarR family winged helix-turn-helix transcriptional regulator [Luethyella okanaganae]|uniref:MarR family winged helix-turn-helix transcriptional regulator n=1 Tax=Luethyella okanaganae TaxID=69372 RepID=A0ABW1VGX0_9MICO